MAFNGTFICGPQTLPLEKLDFVVGYSDVRTKMTILAIAMKNRWEGRSKTILVLGDWFPRKSSRRHNIIYNIYWLLTRFKFIRYTQTINFLLLFYYAIRQRFLITKFIKDKYIEFYFTLDDRITLVFRCFQTVGLRYSDPQSNSN